MWSGINYQIEEPKPRVHNFWCEVFGHKADWKNPKIVKGIFDSQSHCICCKRCGFEMYVTEEVFHYKIPLNNLSTNK